MTTNSKPIWETLGITEEEWNAKCEQTRREMERDGLYMIFCSMRDYAQKTREKWLEIQVRADGSGSINTAGSPGCNEWVAWDDLDRGPGTVIEAIEKWTKQYEEENA